VRAATGVSVLGVFSVSLVSWPCACDAGGEGEKADGVQSRMAAAPSTHRGHCGGDSRSSFAYVAPCELHVLSKMSMLIDSGLRSLSAVEI